MMRTAAVIGVGPAEGLGAYLCRYAAREDLHVLAAGRTASSLQSLCDAIESAGGGATPVVTDATDEAQVKGLIEQSEAIGPLDLAIYNVGNMFAGDFLEMEADFFESAWRVCTFAGFLFARESLRAMLPRGRGTLLFTGASASLRGRPNFAAFTAGKAGLRAMAQSLAREYQPRGIHVGHVVIDGGIAGDKIRRNHPDYLRSAGEDGLVALDGIAEAYMYLYRQPKTAWTHELDLRTFKENF